MTDQTIIDYQKKILDDLNDFNSKYASYVRCSDTYIKANGSCKGAPTYEAIVQSYEKLTTDISAADAFIKKLKPIDKEVTNRDLINLNNQVRKNREELDRKLNELYQKQSSIYGSNVRHLDATIYTGVLWTVLATSIVYYVFIKL